MSKSVGTLFGIGVGPGDPELITMKAHRLLKECSVIAYPKKRMGGASYALDIVASYVDPQEKIMVALVFPMTRDQTVLEAGWNATADAVWEHLDLGRDVAFVTEGDPTLYSTFIHLSRVLKERHPLAQVASVPGISSVNAAAACLDLSLGDGDETLAVVPATGDMAAMKRVLQAHECVVFLKVSKVLNPMLDLLAELDLTSRAAVVTKVTAGDELVWRNVEELRDMEPNYLTLMVVKK